MKLMFRAIFYFYAIVWSIAVFLILRCIFRLMSLIHKLTEKLNCSVLIPLSDWLSSLKLTYKLLRLLLILIIATLLFKGLVLYSSSSKLDSENVLSLLVRIISVISAIVISYLFSKLFAERKERVNRKYEIDEISKKIILLQKISFTIRSCHEFWRISDSVNPKSVICLLYTSPSPRDA